jgi:hypothetical protein
MDHRLRILGSKPMYIIQDSEYIIIKTLHKKIN